MSGSDGDGRSRFRQTLTRVLVVQIGTLLLLGLLQAIYAT